MLRLLATYHSSSSLATLGSENASSAAGVKFDDGVKTAAYGESLNAGFFVSSEETGVWRLLFASAWLTTLTILFWRATSRSDAVLFCEDRRRLFLAAARMRSARVFS